MFLFHMYLLFGSIIIIFNYIIRESLNHLNLFVLLNRCRWWWCILIFLNIGRLFLDIGFIIYLLKMEFIYLHHLFVPYPLVLLSSWFPLLGWPFSIFFFNINIKYCKIINWFIVFEKWELSFSCIKLKLCMKNKK